MLNVSENRDYVIEIIHLYAAYANVVDSGNWEKWPDFFEEDCNYSVIPRENIDGGHPLATLRLEGKGMLKDRVYGIQETLFFEPHYQCHVVGLPFVKEISSDHFETTANYAVFRTRTDSPTEILNVGRYQDIIVRREGCLRFKERICVYDTEIVPTSLIYPI